MTQPTERKIWEIEMRIRSIEDALECNHLRSICVERRGDLDHGYRDLGTLVGSCGLNMESLSREVVSVVRGILRLRLEESRVEIGHYRGILRQRQREEQASGS